MKLFNVAFLLLAVLFRLAKSSCQLTHNFQTVGQQYNLRSPNWPNEYPNNADCRYSLTSPSGTRIQMNCTEVNIEYYSSCRFDKMSVSLSGDATLTKALSICGRGTFSRISSGNSLAVGFKSDSSNLASSSSSVYRFQCLLTVIRSAAPTTTTSRTTTTTSTPAPRPGQGGSSSSSSGGSFINSTCTCGTRNAGARIVGGTNALKNEFPWRVTMYTSRMGHFCSGTILSSRWVMTAAHCTRPAKGQQLLANVGDHDLRSTKETTNEVIKCDKVVEHPNYNSRTQDNDIALCRLEKPLKFTRTVQPICLPWTMASETFQGKTVTASGWGTTSSGGRSSNILQKVDLPVMTTTECRRYYRNAVTNNMICTYQPGKDTCQGDSGGSIDYRDPKSGGRYFGIGVVSWGIGCAGRNQPGVYAKVTNYLTWIQQNTESEKFCR